MATNPNDKENKPKLIKVRFKDKEVAAGWLLETENGKWISVHTGNNCEPIRNDVVVIEEKELELSL